MMTTVDPWEVAGTATVAPRSYYGQLRLDMWFCVLQKGVGKVPFDAGQHKAEDRRTSIDISLLPIPEQNVSFELKREPIAESREWAGVVLPSLQQAAVDAKLAADVKSFDLRKANGAWVKAEFVGTGRRYRGRDGTERENTTFKFLAMYADQDACRAAYATDTGRPLEDDGDDVTEAHPATGGGNGNGNTKERETALQFVKVLVQQHRGDRTAVADQIAAMPMLSKYFTVDSPEVVKLLQEAAA